MPRQNLLFFRSKEKAHHQDEWTHLREQELVRMCLEGNRQAFESIVEQHRNRVFWTAYHMVLDSEDARDITQQCFLKVWQSLPAYDPEKSLRGWVIRIAANCAIDFLRSRREMVPIQEEPVAPANLELNLDIRKMFDRIAPLLSDRQRAVLVLREINGMDVEEIADLLHCTQSTVRNLLAQAKDSFRRKVKEIFPEYGV